MRIRRGSRTVGWFIGDTINVSVGQGETVVTPLQLANAYAAFGNGGTVYTPKLVTSVTDQVTGAEVDRVRSGRQQHHRHAGGGPRPDPAGSRRRHV